MSLSVAFLALTLFAVSCRAMTPLTPEATGREVTDLTLAVIRESSVFQEDNSFFLRMAAVETEFGDDPITYRAGYDGGLWQVDEDRFDNTQDPGTHPDLAAKYALIQTEFGIDWPSLTWSDLRTPLMSGIAAQLYFGSVLGLPIPVTIEAQGSLFRWNWRLDITVQLWIITINARIEVGGDPHVSQIVPGSDKAICYDVFGEDGDIFHFLTDPSANLRINAELNAPGNQKTAMFVEELAVFLGQSQISATMNEIKIDGDSFLWQSNIVQRGHGAEQFVVQIKRNSALIELSLAQINVTKSRNHLDFSINHFGSVNPAASGILGDVANHVSVDERHNGADLVMDINGSPATHRLLNKDKCWKVTHNVDAFAMLLDQNKIDCIAC